MKFFIFNCNNDCLGRKSYLVSAETSIEAENILYKDNDGYIKDKETSIESVEVVVSDEIGFLMKIER